MCHLRGKQLDIVVNSLPSRYSPGETYDVLVGWSEGAEHVSAALEITDADGHGAGEVTLPRGEVLAAEDQCNPSPFPVPAAIVYDMNDGLEDGRQIVGLADCGARQISFQWKAPSSDAGPLWFSGAIVKSDNMSDIDNDGVTEFRRPIAREGSTIVQSTEGGCAVANGARGSRHSWPFFLVGFALALPSRSRRCRA